MSVRNLPVRPDLDQLRHQAKDLLGDFRRGDPAAALAFQEHHPVSVTPGGAQLADAQLVLARSYQAPSWPRLVQACELIDAIWRDDLEAVRALVTQHPRLLHEHATIRDSNWGPPLSYAANLGRDRIIRMLHERGATDLEKAIGRAALQGKTDTVRMLHVMLGSPKPPKDALGGPAYTLSVEGTALLLELGARVRDEEGQQLAAVDVVLESDSRKPENKHAILELYVQHGLELPDTPVMALHRGRLDLLERHLRRDPGLLTRTFTHEEIYPPEFGCHDDVRATQGTPLRGTTLLHLCVDYDELEIFRWLLEQGMNPDTPAAVDAEGLGGHTALFGTVVSQPAFWINYNKRPPAAPFTACLLAAGANPNAKASLRKQLGPGYDDDRVTEVRDASPLAWGRRFHNPLFVNREAMRLIEAAGGVSP